MGGLEVMKFVFWVFEGVGGVNVLGFCGDFFFRGDEVR